eukprot:IDg6099t1
MRRGRKKSRRLLAKRGRRRHGRHRAKTTSAANHAAATAHETRAGVPGECIKRHARFGGSRHHSRRSDNRRHERRLNRGELTKRMERHLHPRADAFSPSATGVAVDATFTRVAPDVQAQSRVLGPPRRALHTVRVYSALRDEGGLDKAAACAICVGKGAARTIRVGKGAARTIRVDEQVARAALVGARRRVLRRS